eukprot:TRINITY_DN45507_c0_g1_i1.p1 TRINITY_DN45507_c0_g1~~TRINITY_DN45507_c0_g1_i1.p1  ORF type:complete len:571 (-),score=41.17 TRINITY_DN45507_c0_g1_i1:267-1928(-)
MAVMQEEPSTDTSACTPSFYADLDVDVLKELSSQNLDCTTVRTVGASRSGEPVEGCDTSVSQLKLSLSPELRRAVNIKYVLSNFGRSLAGSPLNSDDCDHQLLGQQVEQIDDFISHSWATPRWSKYLCLCMIYNGKAALLSSYVASVVLWIAQTACFPAFVERGHGYFAMTCCPLIFVAVLLWGHRIIPDFFASNKVVFLDKLCINQFDEEEKRLATLGLGGFLSRTSRLIILWTPAYFSRLWCVYEVATWLKLNKPPSSILFMPVEMVAICLLGIVCFYISGIVVLVWRLSVNHLSYLPFLAVSCCFAPLGLLAFNKHYQRLKQLPLQLASFSIADTECFCCSNGHIKPGTKQVLECDRKRVLKTIASWYGAPSMTAKLQSREAFSVFEQDVRKLFGEWLESGVVPLVSYGFSLLLTSPALWFYGDKLVVVSSSTDVMKCLVGRASFGFAACPLWVRLVVATYGLYASIESKLMLTRLAVLFIHGLTAGVVFLSFLVVHDQFYVLVDWNAWCIVPIGFPLLAFVAYNWDSTLGALWTSTIGRNRRCSHVDKE